MRLDEYAALDAIDLATLVRRRSIPAGEVCRKAQQAIAAANLRLNFLVGETAAEAERDLRELPADGPLLGVPTMIKDIGPRIGGVVQELGSALARGLVAPEDSELIRRLRGAGAVFIGRTSTPELGSAFTTEPRSGGATRNPWDTTRSTGGSSGGAAAAVAAGVVPFALAGDTAGSIRIPAHCCGVFGLKPTRGRNPTGPEAAESICGLTAAHVISRTVRDSAVVLDATAGADVGCRYVAPAPSGRFLDAVSRPRKGLRIGITTANVFGAGVSDDVRTAVESAGRLCAELGHHVEEAEPPVEAGELLEMLEPIFVANLRHAVLQLQRLTGRQATPENLEASTLAMVRWGERLAASELLDALARMNAFSRRMGRFFLQYDVLLAPVYADVAPRLGEIRTDDPVESVPDFLRETFRLAAFTVQYNLTGQPAMSLPLYESRSGLPVGVQGIARFGDEETLFCLAGQLEAALPWAGRRAPHGIVAHVR